MTTLRELDPAAARELARLGEAVAKMTGQRPAEPAGALTMPALPFRLSKDGAGRELELDHIDGAYYIQATHRRHGVAVNVDLAEVMRGLSRFMPEVTAEPAAPSVEQIARVIYLHGLHVPEAPTTLLPACTAPDCQWSTNVSGHVDRRDAHNAHVAEQIRALYATPGDAGDGGNGVSLEDRAGKNEALWREAEERAEKLESALAASQHNYRNMRDGRLNDAQVENDRLRAEVDRHKAAMEAAERRADEWKAHWRIAQQAHVDQAEEWIETGIAVTDMNRAARAAVEVAPSEEAGA